MNATNHLSLKWPKRKSADVYGSRTTAREKNNFSLFAQNEKEIIQTKPLWTNDGSLEQAVLHQSQPPPLPIVSNTCIVY